MKKLKYPCTHCARVRCPHLCDNKRCVPWSKWFLQQWDSIHRFYLQNGGKA